MTNTAQLALDRLAIGVSALCAVHCVATPILLVLLPSLSALPIADHHFHEMLVWVVLPTSAVAVTLGCKRHKDTKVWLLALTGLAVLMVSAFFGHDFLGEVGEKIATLIGALIVALAHWRNFKLCRKKQCCD
ncbi:MerC domain-containing protein [Shewanella maritima]|uniref:MerC domain-containing protein n=1 Tax=Shewanella maritima TaxID=2520507 RepID=A0A411PJ50_9GAMM|nr:MerC domain-containing protein [Shewanella maritima]QBF83599.1 MerC domain-containing protein [Shewanella maritima]